MKYYNEKAVFVSDIFRISMIILVAIIILILRANYIDKEEKKNMIENINSQYIAHYVKKD